MKRIRMGNITLHEMFSSIRVIVNLEYIIHVCTAGWWRNEIIVSLSSCQCCSKNAMVNTLYDRGLSVDGQNTVIHCQNGPLAKIFIFIPIRFLCSTNNENNTFRLSKLTSLLLY